VRVSIELGITYSHANQLTIFMSFVLQISDDYIETLGYDFNAC
jgi:hypothetical protein